MIIGDELQDLQLDKPKRGKSEDQLAKHTLDPTLDNKPIERALFLLTKGDEVQKINVVETLPQLLNSNTSAVQNRIIPKIQQDLPNSSSEFNIAASRTYKVLIEKRVPVETMNVVYQGIESRDPVVSNAWFDTLIDVVKVLDESQIKEKVLPFARDKSNLNQPLYHRVASCKIFGAVSTYPRFTPTDVKREVLPAVQSLCQDCHPEIRGAIAIQIPHVMKGLGSMPDKSILLPCLVELANDEKISVRSAAVSAIVGCFPYTNQDTIKDTIVPLIKRLYEKYLEITDSATVMLAKELGVILKTIEPYLTPLTAEWYLKVFKTLSVKGKTTSMRETLISQEVLCRDHCAANLPAVAEMTLLKIPDKFEIFYSTFKSLACDPCFVIRRTVAEHFHEVSKVIGSKNNSLKPELISLLKDDVDEIVQAIVMNLDLILETLTTQRYLSKKTVEPMTNEIGNALIKCQNQLIKSNNWRLLTNFLNRLQYLPNCMTSDYLHQNFTPFILNIAMEARAKPIRTEACRTLLWFLRHNARETQKQWLRDNLISNLCYSSSFYTRQIFIRLCSDALEIFNNKYFKDYFFIPLISMIDDRIANIRYGVVQLMPQLRLTLSPQDSVLQKLYNNAINKLKFNEKDRDVKRCFEKLKKDLEGPISNAAIESMLLLEKKKQDLDPIYRRRISDTVYQKTTLPIDIGPGSLNVKGSQKNASIGIKSTDSKISSGLKPRIAENNHDNISKSDLNFLDKHFYVDAGMVFPTKNDKTSENEVSVKSEEINQIFDRESTKSIEQKLIEHNITLNITDDDKCKFQLKTIEPALDNKNNTINTPQSNRELLNKRHSSFLPAFTMQSFREKFEKRRSLTITSKEKSKIPVCLKQNISGVCEVSNDKKCVKERSFEIKAQSENICSKSNNDRTGNCFPLRENGNRASFLPVFRGSSNRK